MAKDDKHFKKYYSLYFFFGELSVHFIGSLEILVLIFLQVLFIYHLFYVYSIRPCIVCLYSTQRDQKRVLDPVELELQMVELNSDPTSPTP